MMVCLSLVLLSGQNDLGQASAELSSEEWSNPLQYDAWHINNGELHFVLHMTPEERQAWSTFFWKVQRVLAQHGLANGYTLWRRGGCSGPQYCLQRLRLTEIDATQQAMVCLSDVPLHASASAFLRAIGCLWPEG